jgi:hypothetical protein
MLSFLQTHSLLVLQETQLANPTQVGNHVALYGADSSDTNNNRGGDDRDDHGDHTRFGDGNNNRNYGGGGGYYRKKRNNGCGNNNGAATTAATALAATTAPARHRAGRSSCWPLGLLQPVYVPGPAGPASRDRLVQLRRRRCQHPRPTARDASPAQAFTSLAPLHGQAFGTNAPPIPGYNPPSPSNHGGNHTWDCTALIQALNNAATPSTVGEWVMDSGTTTHMAFDPDMLYSLHKPSPSSFVTVGNGSTLPISHIGHASLSASARTLHLNNVLLVPNIVKNLISIHHFTIDNCCSIEFDPFGFSVKDLRTMIL